MDNPIIKYTKQQYTAKITELEGCISTLSTHLDYLESLKSQVSSFWNDPQADGFLENLTTAIISVRNAQDRTTKLMTTYQSTIDEMEGVTATTTGIIDDIGGVISALGIGK